MAGLTAELKKKGASLNLSGAECASGGRKASHSRVRVLKDGSGKFIVNGKDVASYFCRADHVIAAKKPLTTLDVEQHYDVVVKVEGGGFTGQAGAISNGLAKAFAKMSAVYKRDLRSAGLMTRDSRAVESKKVGFRKARRRRQFSKR